MHELGIVMNAVEQVEKAAADNGVQKVVGVTMEIGEVSTVVPELFPNTAKNARIAGAMKPIFLQAIRLLSKILPPCQRKRKANKSLIYRRRRRCYPADCVLSAVCRSFLLTYTRLSASDRRLKASMS